MVEELKRRMLMFFITMLAILLLSARIAVTYRKDILDTIAVCTAGMVMVIYGLGFFHAFVAVGYVAVMVMVWVAVKTVIDAQWKPEDALRRFGDYGKALVNPYVILLVLTVTGVAVATSASVITWWDDINFWSSDAKQLFYMNGFPGKYGNVSPEFGDYPPVTSLFKWLFLKIFPDTYLESLQFAGYFALNAVFLLPLLAMIKGYIESSGFGKARHLTLPILAFIAVMLFPGVFNGIIYYGTPADVTMAIVYGALLLAIYDQYDSGDTFYYIRIGLYASVLLLTKNVGFEWALFAFVFYILIGKRDKKIWISVLMAAASYGSWLLFCLVNRRVAKLTGAGIKMATGGTYSTPDNTMDKLSYFVQGFLTEPMHTDHNLTLDLSTAAAVLIILVGIIVLYYRNVLGRSEVKKIFLFTLLTGLLSYGIVFLAHISIFGTEDQYLDAYAMGISISRYCAPFTLGMSYLLIGMLFNRLRTGMRKKRSGLAVVFLAAAVLLTADYSGVYRHLVGNRKSAAEDMAAYEDMVGDEGRAIVSAVDDPVYWGDRVIILRDGHSYYWVHNAYINKEASPVPLVYDGYIIEEDTPESIVEKINASHAKYLLVEDETGASKELFSRVLIEEFEPGKVYLIEGNLR